MERSDIINQLIKTYKYHSYLEIGYGTGYTFHKIEAPMKVGVDDGAGTPMGDSTIVPLRSEDYFKMAKEQGVDKYDIIFIDGSHLCEDVTKDLSSALEFLNEEGSIVMHDCSPPNIYYQERSHTRRHGGQGRHVLPEKRPPPRGSSWIHIQTPPSQSPGTVGWTGDTWKTFVKFRATRPDLEMCVVDTDYGCGIVRRGTQQTLDIDIEKDLIYENLDANRTEWLNLISIEEFIERHG